MQIRHRLLALSAVYALTYLLTMAGQTQAGEVRLSWQDPNNPPAEVGGYNVYYRQTAWPTPVRVNVGKPTLPYTLAGLEVGKTYHFTVTAYDLSGGRESPLSNEATTVIQPPPSSTTLLEAHFETGTDGFAYADDAFYGTRQPNYAAGDRSGGALRVTLGGIDDATITNMSGGWRRNFTVSGSTIATVSLSFRYNLTQASNYEAEESSDMLVTVGTQYLGTSGRVARLTGDGNGGSALTTGWRTFTTTVQLAPGTYALTLGSYNNKKTYRDEVTTALIDDVVVTRSGAALQQALTSTVSTTGHSVPTSSPVSHPRTSAVGRGNASQPPSQIRTAADTARREGSGAPAETTSPGALADVKIWLEAEAGELTALLERGVDPEASAGAYIRVPEQRTLLNDLAFQDMLMRYTVTVPATDTYVVWGRVRPEAAGSGAIIITLQAPKTAARPTTPAYALVWPPLAAEESATPDDTPAWVWDQVAGDTMPIVLLEAGTYTLTMMPQSRGIKIDQLLITNDLEYRP